MPSRLPITATETSPVQQNNNSNTQNKTGRLLVQQNPYGKADTAKKKHTFSIRNLCPHLFEQDPRSNSEPVSIYTPPLRGVKRERDVSPQCLDADALRTGAQRPVPESTMPPASPQAKDAYLPTIKQEPSFQFQPQASSSFEQSAHSSLGTIKQLSYPETEKAAMEKIINNLIISFIYKYSSRTISNIRDYLQKDKREIVNDLLKTHLIRKRESISYSDLENYLNNSIFERDQLSAKTKKIRKILQKCYNEKEISHLHPCSIAILNIKYNIELDEHKKDLNAFMDFVKSKLPESMLIYYKNIIERILSLLENHRTSWSEFKSLLIVERKKGRHEKQISYSIEVAGNLETKILYQKIMHPVIPYTWYQKENVLGKFRFFCEYGSFEY